MTDTGKDIKTRAARVRWLFLDVDGTLTDGRMHIGKGGALTRSYHTLDGHGMRRFMAAGGGIAIITAAAEDDSIRYRMEDLGVRHVHIAVGDKLAKVKEVLAAEALDVSQTAYVGDDVQDLAALEFVGASGLACAPKTAMPEVLAAAHYIPARPAGGGAVREVIDLIMAQWQNSA
ncbi:MAG: KdsC family phosphatase [Gammaproteobacteria bacterium]